MIVIGLTGPSGSGKGWVSSILDKYNIPTIDTDAVYHDLLIPPSPCLSELVDTFGSTILTDNKLNRPALAAIVFSDPEKLKLLNRITHKYILKKTDSLLQQYEKDGYQAATVDAPALFESGYDKKCDFVIAVTAPQELRLQRILRRDSISIDNALKRISAQPDDEFYSSRAKYTVCNNNDDVQLTKDLCAILEQEGISI